MKVYVVFKTKSNGTKWHDEVHCVRESKADAEKALKDLQNGYICDYDTK